MRAAIVQDGVVTNIIVVGSLDDLPDLIDGSDAHIGDTWDGQQFIRAEQPIIPPEKPRMTEEEKEQLILSQSEMIALLFEAVLGGGTQ